MQNLSKVASKEKITFKQKLVLGGLLLESLILPISCVKNEEVSNKKEEITTDVFTTYSSFNLCDDKFDIIPFQLNEQFQKVGSTFLVKQTTNLELFNSETGKYYLISNPSNRKYSAFYLNESVFLIDIDVNDDKVILLEFKQNNPRRYVLPLSQEKVEYYGIKDNALYFCSNNGKVVYSLTENGLYFHDLMTRDNEEYLKSYKPIKAK